jgi:hypothetical protein
MLDPFQAVMPDHKGPGFGALLGVWNWFYAVAALGYSNRSVLK